MSARAVVLTLLGLWVEAGPGPLRAGAPPDGPRIHVTPETPLLDDVLSVRVTGLPAGKEVTLRARAESRGRAWESRATFTADTQGVVDLRKDAPVRGTYSGADPMGLFWSMQPGEAKAGPPPPAPAITDPRVTRLEVVVEGKVVASAEVRRWLARPGVRVTAVKEKGLVGKLFEPEKKGRHPAVLVLSGSEGGMNEPEAAVLASRGYTAFALAYFRADGLPKQLVKIPLEYLKKGIDWLKERDSVDARRLGVVGASKGGELALLLGATFPEIRAVVARVPSHVVWSGIGGTYQESSWTYQGKPLPCVATRPGVGFFAQLAGNKPVRLVDIYLPGLKDEEAVKKATIPVEKISGAVLLISGKEDEMWPSAAMADAVVERLKKHKHPHPCEHLCYAGAGHAVPSFYSPLKDSVAAGRFALGGTPEANARALADSRPKFLRFLKDHLGGP